MQKQEHYFKLQPDNFYVRKIRVAWHQAGTFLGDCHKDAPRPQI
jgi:hypothetical protein